MDSALTLYGDIPAKLVTQRLNWDVAEVKVALLDATYDPSVPARRWADVKAHEVAEGNGYTAGGNPCVNPRVAYSPARGAIFAAEDPTSWRASGDGFAFRYLVTYDAASGELIGYEDYGSTLNLRSGDVFSYGFDPLGVFTATVA